MAITGHQTSQMVDHYTKAASQKIRAKAAIEIDRQSGKERIIVTEIPYQVNKSRLIESIANLVREKTIEGITDLRDESDKDGMRIVVEVRKGDSLEAATETMLEVVETVGDETPSKAEVERAKRQLLKRRELAESDTGLIAVRLSDWAAQGDWRLYLLHRDRLEKVTPQQVQDVAKRYLRRENRTLGIFIPSEKSEKTPIPPGPDLATLFDDYKSREEVAGGEAFDPTPANVDARSQRITLAEGVKGILLPKKTRGESVNVRLVLHYGDLDSLKGYQAAADMLPLLMTRGTKNLTRQQIQDELDENRATLSAGGSPGKATFAIQTKRANLPAVLNLLKQILREPTLPADEFDVLRRRQLARLEEQLTNPTALAITRVRRLVSPYAEDDVRYVPTIEENIQRYADVTREQVKMLYDEFLGARAGELVIVGDFDPAENSKILQEALSGWTAAQSYARIPAIYFPDVPGVRQEILTPDKANATYMAGLVFPLKESGSDYPAILIGNYVFGGGSLSSRLGDRIRQKEGLSYGVGSALSVDPLDARSSLTIYALCNPKNIEKVNAAINEELTKLLADGVTAAELARAKQGYLQRQQVAWTNDGVLAAMLAENLFVDRTMAFYGELEKRINALSPEQVLVALRKYIDPKRLVVVDAGDFAKEASATK
ncbi:MAG: insulinase family protein [Planctomycetes bacterium]|nr:insulinase family protein [Planctomycetota bacterium]